MNGKVALLLKKMAGGNPWRLRELKKAWNDTPRSKRKFARQLLEFRLRIREKITKQRLAKAKG